MLYTSSNFISPLGVFTRLIYDIKSVCNVENNEGHSQRLITVTIKVLSVVNIFNIMFDFLTLLSLGTKDE